MKQRLIGSWELISFVASADDQRSHPYGLHPSGLLVYTADDWITVHVMGQERPHIASGDMQRASEAELRAAFNQYAAYYGRYEVDEAQQMVHHHIKGSLFPNWVGQVQRRRYVIDGDRLELSAPPLLLDGRTVSAVFTWRRVDRDRAASAEPT